MKRLICIIISLVIATCFVGCSKEKASSDSKIDIEYYVKSGKIPECSYSLGNDIDTIKDDSAKRAEDEDYFSYNITEGKKTTLIDAGEFSYYYINGKESDGVSFIVDKNTAYGFSLGTISVEIKNSLNDFKCTELNADENTVFFMNYGDNCTVLKYEIGDNVLLFVFENNALSATAIYNSTNWSL